MRNKVIDRIKELLANDGGFDPDYEDHLGFVPQSDADIESMTDEQLIRFLEIYGIFLG